MAVMAQFKTAYLQREVRVDAKVAAEVKVGQLCTLSEGSIAAKTSATAAVGDVIIAQSDMTVGKGHVPVENRDHNYSNKVAASTSAKHVMVFFVTDPNDLVLTTV